MAWVVTVADVDTWSDVASSYEEVALVEEDTFRSKCVSEAVLLEASALASYDDGAEEE